MDGGALSARARLAPAALRRMLKQAMRRTTGRFGFQLVNSDNAAKSLLRFHLSRIFAVNAIDCVIDVGANRGQYVDFLRREVGYRGPIHAFEPLPDLAAGLRRRFQGDSAVQIHAFALGSADGECQFNRMEVDEYSSLLTPSTREAREHGGKNVVRERLALPMRTLDGLCRSGALPLAAQRVYLKLDTQGYDLEVLNGARVTLSRVAALQTEAAFLRIYEGMPGFIETFSRLKELGFSPSGLFPVSVDAGCRLIEADCVFSRGGSG